jgi:hypothetical protein
MFIHRLTRTAAVTVALAAAAAPAASAEPIDAARGGIHYPTPAQERPQDLRGADAQGAPAGSGIEEPTPAQDMRHADTRDYAEGRGTYNSPDVVVLKAPAATEPVATGGVDWEQVGIGAGGVLSIVLIGAGGMLVVARRRSVRLAG